MCFPRSANSVAFIFYGSCCANSTELSPIRSVIIRVVDKIGRPRSERHSVLLPIYQNYDNIYETNQPSVMRFRKKKKETPALHASYWEITQAWRTPIMFDNFSIVLISLVRRMTVSFLLLGHWCCVCYFKHFFPLFYGMSQRKILHIFSQFNYEFLFSQGGDSFKWRMRTARMGTKYSWLKKHTHENLQVRTSFLHFVVLFL